jgi:alkylhydroperoxidase family enzyme
VGSAAGLTDQDIAEVSRFERSDAFGELDRLVLQLASAMTETPAEVPEELRRALVDRLGRAALAEVAATIAWENHRARLNRALGVRPAGFSDGAVCALAAHQDRPVDPVERGVR